MANKTLEENGLLEEGVIILSAQTRMVLLGTLDKLTCIHPKDNLIAYGRKVTQKALNERCYGNTSNKQHIEAVAKQKQRQKMNKKIYHQMGMRKLHYE